MCSPRARLALSGLEHSRGPAENRPAADDRSQFAAEWLAGCSALAPCPTIPPMNAASFMQQALDLAARSVGLSEPNPRVGCVIVSADGAQVLGAGHTQRAGEAHAEIM